MFTSRMLIVYRHATLLLCITSSSSFLEYVFSLEISASDEVCRSFSFLLQANVARHQHTHTVLDSLFKIAAVSDCNYFSEQSKTGYEQKRSQVVSLKMAMA